MFRLLPALSLLVFPLFSGVTVHAASFDCGKAATPFEQAICGDEGLSKADERMARSYSFALAGLSDEASELVKRSQQSWLRHAQRACTDENEPLQAGSYDERMTWCLSDLYGARADALEISRFYRGERLYTIGEYASALDSYRIEEPDFRWPVGRHELTIVQLDSDAPYAEKLNAALRAEGEERSSTSGELGEDGEDDAGGEDTSVVIDVQGGFWDSRVSFTVESSWYPHGAAHGGHTTSFLHYLVDEERFAQADDLFEGKKWQSELAKLTATAMSQQLGPILFPDSGDASGLEDIVSDVTRWDFSNYLGLTIQFQPYEVTAYAYGTPTVFLLWDSLEPLIKEGSPLR